MDISYREGAFAKLDLARRLQLEMRKALSGHSLGVLQSSEEGGRQSCPAEGKKWGWAFSFRPSGGDMAAGFGYNTATVQDTAALLAPHTAPSCMVPKGH